MYATLYNDNADIRVYGTGTTENESEVDARRTVRDLGWTFDNYVTVEITTEQFRGISAGDVDARNLGIRYSQHRHALGH